MISRLHPEPFLVTLTFAWVVGLFSAAAAPLQDLWRPLVLALVASVVVGVVGRLLSASGRWPTIVVGVLWMLAIGAWPIAAGLGLVVLWRRLIDAYRRAAGRSPVREPAGEQVTRVANALGAAGVVVAALSLVNSGAIQFRDQVTDPIELPIIAEAPSMYLILLDGYPASATLRDEFGFDNRPFEEALAELDFSLPDDSRSNYNRTLLTLASMLEMRYVNAVPALATPREGFAAQNRQLTAAINDARVVHALRDAGYETVAIGSSYGEATLTSGDRVVSTGAMTLLEEQLLRYTAVGNWLIGTFPELVAEQHRDGIRQVLERTVDAASQASRPAFVLAHVFSPHAPFVFNADGTPRAVHECYPHRCGLTAPESRRIGLSREEYADGLTQQVAFVNDQVIELVDRLAATDPSAAIIVFSDHGARYDEGPTDEHFMTFFAARTPGQPDLFTSPVGLVNVFPTLFNAYFGTQFPIHAYRAGYAPDEAPLEPTPVD